MAQTTKYDLDYLRELGKKVSNWGKWGPDDEVGTMNYITPDKIAEAARLYVYLCRRGG